MASLSTHVLDTSGGRPATGIAVTLEGADGTVLAEGVTDADGQVRSFRKDDAEIRRKTPHSADR